MLAPPQFDRAMLTLFDFALLASASARPVVVVLGASAPHWRTHLVSGRGCRVVDLGVTATLDGRVDLVCALDVLHCVREPRAWLRGIAGLLRPGGRLLTTVPNAASVDWWWQTVAEAAPGRPPGRVALIRDHQHVGFLTLGHGYVGCNAWGFRRGTRRPGAWARAWRRRLAPRVYYLGARAGLTTRRALATPAASAAFPRL